MDPNFIVALCAFVVSFVSLLRGIGKDSKNNSAELTTVIVKLENIGSDITEIKKDMRSVKADVREHGEKIAKLEQKIAALEQLVDVYHKLDESAE